MFYRKIYSTVIFSIITSSCLFSMGLFEEPELTEPEESPLIQDVYEELDDTLPVIGLFEPQINGNISEEEGNHLYTSFAENLVTSGKYKPYSLNEWFEEEYRNNLPWDIIQIQYEIKKLKFPMDYFSTINISKFSDKYFVQISLYSIDDITDVLYFYRILDDLEDGWDYILPDLRNEMDFRIMKDQNHYISQTIYVEPFSVQYYQYYELQNGEYSFTKLPFLTMNGEDFRSGDDMFSKWMGMRLHLSGFFPVIIDDLSSLVRKDMRRKPGCTWGIKGEIRISNVMSVLRLQIYDYKRQKITSTYDFPFNGLSSLDISAVIDTSLPFILNSILSAGDQKRITVMIPDFTINGDRIYTENGYQGPAGTVCSFPAIIGLNKYLIVQDERILLEENDEEGNPLEMRRLFIPELASFNSAILVGPGGEARETYTEKEILYAEKLFE